MLNLKLLPVDAAYITFPSPVGPLTLIGSNQGLHYVMWATELNSSRAALAKLKLEERHPVLQRAKRQLEEYFAGQRTEFDLPLAPHGTDFQKRAWLALRKIPYGKTISYLQQANQLGDGKKARAVGTANSRNPISIIVPCHRVIATSGALSGFGGGIENKRRLLDIEKGSKAAALVN